ncbi:hypothetical protein QVD17_08628 [Tagetes erecta]|uniref:Uncharacterized protein n=1 Tax=Tagetes erecta TaxID=13708 RepID=A0AAD8L0B4_TARER|nr:hypothetical protein QVD17_08628 [Tagetes erecta]
MPLSLSHLNHILSKSFLTLPIFFTVDSSGIYFFISHSLLISTFFFFSSFHLLSMPTTPVAPPPSLPVGPTSPSLIDLIHVLNITGLFDFEDVATGSLTG